MRDKTLENIRSVIDEHGWWVGLIDARGDEPGFAYTIGLYERFEHPEIIIFGLARKTMHTILNGCGALVRGGTRLADGSSSDDVLEGYAVRFRAVTSRESHETWLGIGCRFYDRRDFPVLQCVWPDKEHRFPDDDGAASFLRLAQPLLR